MPTFLEFFAGGEMARAGLGPSWTCLFANDFDERKAASYRANWGAHDLWVGDVRDLQPGQLPGEADLGWASFPCQDLSLAGSGAGLAGSRSGTFWAFWGHVTALRAEGRAPATIVLENVHGTLTSRKGADFAAILDAVAAGGYRCGAVVVDAAHFVPQSRPRLFIIAAREDITLPGELVADGPSEIWHPSALRAARARLSGAACDRWVWWNLPDPEACRLRLADLIEPDPVGVAWHSAEQTARLLSMMSDTNRAKVAAAGKSGRQVVGTIYRRTRPDGPLGTKVQRAEVRFDDIAGCLRTPAGGSSRQTLILVDGDSVRTRLLSPREAARLMGLPDDYILPPRYNDAYHLAGDGVAVPVVRFIADRLLEPILQGAARRSRKAA